MGEKTRRRRSLWYTVLLLLSVLISHASSKSPYAVLNVPKNASQGEIRKAYRKLCLEYHPDKNVSSSKKVKKVCEEKFKEIQLALEQVGDEESRRRYDTTSHFRQFTQASHGATHPSSNFYGRNQMGSTGESLDEAIRAFFHANRAPSFVFMRSGSPAFRREMKAIYTQTVNVPLETLINGISGYEVQLNCGLLERCMAAFRGGSAAFVLYTAAVISFPVMRISRWLSLAVFGYAFQAQLPDPPKKCFFVDIKPGYKGGTKIKFTTPQSDVVFVLEEEPHASYRREGNNLHTKVTISPDEALNGCTVSIKHIAGPDGPVSLELTGPIENGKVRTLHGRGWQNRKTGKRGDLLVEIRIDRKKKRST